MDNSIDTLYVDIRLRTTAFDAGLRDLQNRAATVAATIGTTASNSLNTAFGQAFAGGTIGRTISASISASGQAITASSTQAGQRASTAFAQGFSGGTGFTRTLSSSLSGAWRNVASNAQQAGQSTATSFTSSLMTGISLSSQNNSGISQAAARIFTRFGSTATQASSTIGQTAGTAMSGAMVNAINPAAFNTNVWGRIQNGMRAVMGDIRTGLTSSLGNLDTAFANSLRGMTTTASQMGGRIGDTLGSSIAVAVGIATAGLFVGLTKQMSNWAYEADQARISFDVWNRTVERAGISTDKASQSINNMSSSLKVSKITLMEQAAGLIRMGFSMEQVETAFTVASASAVRAGKDTTYGIEQVSQALLTGNSRFLNTIGIRLNLVDAEKMYAQEIGKTKSQLTDAERLQAKVNLLWRDSGAEVEYLAGSLSGLSGATSDNKIALEQMRQTIGQAFVPVTNMAVRSITEMVQSVTNWAKNTESGRQSMQTLSTAATNFGQSMKSLAGSFGEFTKTQTFKDFASIAVSAFNNVKDTAITLITLVKTEWPKMAQPVSVFASEFKKLWDTVSPIIDALKRSILTISPIFTGVVNAVVSMVSAVIKGVRSLIETISAILTGDWKKAWDSAVEAVTAFTKNLIEWPAEQITAGIKGVIDNIKTLWASGGESWGTAAAESMNQVTDQAIADNLKKVDELKKQIAARNVSANADQIAPNYALNQVNDPLGLNSSGVVAQPKASNQVQQQLKPDLGLSIFMKQLGRDMVVSVMQELGANKDKYRLTGGKGHPGIDYQIGSGPNGGQMGAPVYAPSGFAGATVLRADNTKSGYGNSIELQLQNGYKVLLGHFQQLGVKAGQKIQEGMMLGAQGNTGWGFSKLGSGEGMGPVHLHVEARDMKGNIVFDKGSLETILTAGKTQNDKFINSVSDRQTKATDAAKAKPDPSFAELVKQLVALNREFDAAGKALKTAPTNQSALSRYQKASNALDAAKDKSSTYKDGNLYQAAQAAAEKILETEGASYKINEAKVTKLLPQAVTLLKRQAELEGSTGIVATANLKEYYDLKNKIADIGKSDDGKEALSLAQKRIEAEKQGLHLTDAMTQEALKLSRALRDAKDNSALDPKGLAAAQQAVDAFNAKGKSQQFASSWADSVVAKEAKAMPAFEAQLASAEKLVKQLFKAQSMAFGPERTKAVNDASEAIKKFSESNSNAALAVTFAQEKYGKLKAISDSASASARAKAIPLQTDTQLRDKLKAEQAKGAAADLSFIQALQAEIDKRMESLKKKREDYANAFNDNIQRLSAVGANKNLYDRAKVAIGALISDDPRQILQDMDYLKQLQAELDKVGKQPGSELFAGLKDQLSSAIPTAQELSDRLNQTQDDLAKLNETDFSGKVIEQMGTQVDDLNKRLAENPYLSQDSGFMQEITDVHDALQSMLDLPDMYSADTINSLMDGLQKTSDYANALLDSFDQIGATQEENNAQIEEYNAIQQKIVDLQDQARKNPLLVDRSQIEALQADVAALDQTDAVKATSDELQKLADNVKLVQDEYNTLAKDRDALTERSGPKADPFQVEMDGRLEQYRQVLKDLATSPEIVLNFNSQGAYEDLKKFFEDNGKTVLAKSLSDAWDLASGNIRNAAESDAVGQVAAEGDARRKRLNDDLDNLKTQVYGLLDEIAQWPGVTLAKQEDFDFIKLQLSRLSDDPVFGSMAKRFTDDLDAGWQAAIKAASEQERVDSERQAQYDKAAAEDTARGIASASTDIIDAFKKSGDVAEFLQSAKNLKIYIDGESIKGVSQNIDDILSSVESQINGILNNVGHLHETERKAIENDLALNEIAFAAKSKSQEDYYNTKYQLSKKALDLESTDQRDALDKQLSDNLLSMDDYWKQVAQLESDKTTKLAAINDAFKLPAIQEATKHLDDLKDRVAQLTSINAPEIFPDIQKSIGDTLNEINDFANKDLLSNDQQSQLNLLSSGLVAASDGFSAMADDADTMSSKVDGSLADMMDAIDELNMLVEGVTLGQIAPDDFIERLRLLKPMLQGFDLSGIEIPQEARASLTEALNTLQSFEGLYESSAPQAKVFGNAIRKLADDVKSFTEQSVSGKLSVDQFNAGLEELKKRADLLKQNPMNTGFYANQTSDISKQLDLTKFGQDAPKARELVDQLTSDLKDLSQAFADGSIDQGKYITLLGHLKEAFAKLASGSDTSDAVKKISINASRQIDATLNSLKYANSGISDIFNKMSESIGKGSDSASKVMSIGLSTLAKVVSSEGKGIEAAVLGVMDMVVAAISTGNDATDKALADFVAGIKGAFQALMTGNWAAAAISFVGGVIQGIIDWVSGGARQMEELKQKMENFRDSLKNSFVDAQQYIYKTKFLGKDFDIGFDSVGANLAKSISDGITGGFKAGMKAAINGDANWQDIIKNGMRDALIDGFIEAFIQKAVLQGILAAPLTALSKAFESGDQGAIDAAMAAFSAMLPKAMDAIDKIIPGFVDTLNKAFPGMGAGGPGSLDYEQKKLADLQAKFGKATSDEERKKLQAQIDAQQAVIDKIKAKTEKEKPGDAGPGSLDYENKILQDLMDKYNKETDAAKRLLLAGEIEKQKAKIKSLDPLNNPYKYGDIVKRNPDGTPDLTGGGTYITGNIKALPMLGVPDVPTGDTAVPFGVSVKNFGIHVDKFGEYMKYAEMIKEAAIALGPQQSTKDKPSITNWGIISKR